MTTSFSEKLLAYTIECYFVVRGFEQDKTFFPYQYIDFVVTDKKGKKVGIEIKAVEFDLDDLIARINRTGHLNAGLEKFLLVRTQNTEPEKVAKVKEYFSRLNCEVNIIGINQLPSELGDDEQIDLLDRNVQRELEDEADRVRLGISVAKAMLPRELEGLEKHAPPKLLREMYEELKAGKTEKEVLRIGENVQDVVVVLSDIKDFSRITKATGPSHMNKVMAKYYHTARELAFDYGGYLDKFMGDAVFAIFGYPFSYSTPVADAIRFSSALIYEGNKVIEMSQDCRDDIIGSGTRVGIAIGELTVVDVGKTRTEPSFIGDAINLAARLEHSCSTNAIRFSNQAKCALLREHLGAAFFNTWSPIQLEMPVREAKGQSNPISCFELSAGNVMSLYQPTAEMDEFVESSYPKKQ